VSRGEWAKTPMRRHKPETPFDQLCVMIEAIFYRGLRRLPVWPEKSGGNAWRAEPEDGQHL